MDLDAKKYRLPESRERQRGERVISPTVGLDAGQSASTVPMPREPSLSLSRTFDWKNWIAAAALVVAVFVVYLPCWHGGFLWDDEIHLLNNPVLMPGGLAKVWVPGGYINYWPLTFTAYWLQFQLWGLQPLGFHLVNLALHALSALLVWRVLLRLQVPGALFAAAIFALHPVNVETAAWIAHLKDILSLALALVSMIFYFDSERHVGRWRYAAAIFAFLLSALAKGTAVTLPVVLLACAWWQRGRIDRRDLLRVVPYLLIGALMTGVEVWTQQNVAQDFIVRADGFFSRMAIAGCALWFYLGKLILPLGLSPIYPRWTIDDRSLLSYLPGLMWVALLAGAWWRRRTWGRPVVMLIVCYTALLLPVLGFANIYFMRYSLVSDHWQYIATIVPYAAFAGVATTLARRFLDGPAAIGAAVALLFVLAALSWRQSGIYADIETFYEAIIARNRDCWLAQNNIGTILVGQQLDSAIAHYQQAIDSKPDYAEAHNNLGAALAARGQFDLAIVQYNKALEIKPDYAEPHCNLGNAMAARGQIDSAIVEYQKALAIKPAFAEAHFDLGNALLGRGQIDAAISHYQRAVEIEPDYFDAHYNLGNALIARGQVDAAIAQYEKALEIKPRSAEVEGNLASALAGRGDVDSAIAHFQKALEIDPNNRVARQNLAVLAKRDKIRKLDQSKAK